jgi:hypothetical protein
LFLATKFFLTKLKLKFRFAKWSFYAITLISPPVLMKCPRVAWIYYCLCSNSFTFHEFFMNGTYGNIIVIGNLLPFASPRPKIISPNLIYSSSSQWALPAIKLLVSVTITYMQIECVNFLTPEIVSTQQLHSEIRVINSIQWKKHIFIIPKRGVIACCATNHCDFRHLSSPRRT